MSLDDGLAALDRIGVGGPRVVGDRITRDEPELLEIDRVSGRHLGERLCAAKQLDGLFLAAIDRVDELELLHAEVVRGLGLDEQLFDRPSPSCRVPA